MSAFLKLEQKHSGYAGNPQHWNEFLGCWYQQEKAIFDQRYGKNSGEFFEPLLHKFTLPAKQQISAEPIDKAIADLEKRIGVKLPKSYLDFLQAYAPPTNSGYQRSYQGDYSERMDIGMYAPHQVDRYVKLAPQMLVAEEEWAMEVPDHEYFVYGVDQDDASGRTKYHRDAIVVGTHGYSAYEVIVLYVTVPTTQYCVDRILYAMAA